MGRVSDARQRLLEAANELTWKLGYNAVTVDGICEKADVRKGSFYHYFESKPALAKAALEAQWESYSRPLLEASFAADIPPLERLKRYMETMYKNQKEKKQRGERILGCPIFSVAMSGEGVEAEVVEAAQQALKRKLRYFQAAIQAANDAGLIKVDDVGTATQAVYSLFEGAWARARIQNNPEPLAGLYEQALRLLGATEQESPPKKSRVA
jgi:TetR/AcrR family transcriptional regulator, transcriptional repressor for nem operon